MMQFRPQWKQCFRCEVIPSEGVILLSDRGHILLRGDAYLQVAPLLDGQHTVQAMIERLHGSLSAAEVFYTLDLLKRDGFLADAVLPFAPEQAAFWELLNVEPQGAIQRLQEKTVSIVTFGGIDATPFYSLLGQLGLQAVNDGLVKDGLVNDSQCDVVLTDDYLHEELATFNQEALSRCRPWLLIKPVGTEPWIGPLFLPGQTGCWACLAQRLRGARKVESYLAEKKNVPPLLTAPVAALPSTLQTVYGMAATELAKWIMCGGNEEIEGHVVTLDVFSLIKQRHQLVRRPQCPSCGDPATFAVQQTAPIELARSKKVAVPDGGHRASAPEDTWKRLEHHVSPVTGIASFVKPMVAGQGAPPLNTAYIAGHNFAYVSKECSLDLEFLKTGIERVSAGKGKHAGQAKTSALCEALERYSGIFQGDETRIKASYKTLDMAAIHPNACMLFSREQLNRRAQSAAHTSWLNWVPESFCKDREIEWSPAWSLTYNTRRWVPTAYCYYGYARKTNAGFARADSNGCAAGNSKEEAILQGFLELAERDSVALWWYNRLKKPAVDLSRFADPYLEELQTYYSEIHRDLWVLDITSDLNLPTVAAISRRQDKRAEDIIFGFGTHFDPRVAVLSAMAELNQSLYAVFNASPDNDHAYLDTDPHALSWWQTATLENQPYLAPDETVTPKGPADFPGDAYSDFHEDIQLCVKVAEQKGLETLVLDQTRPDVGLHAVKVIVPGLRHFWPRLAPGRLYDVPVEMGELSEPLREDQLNPRHIYF